MAARKVAGEKRQPGPAAASNPVASRPQLPPEYGLAPDTKGLLQWERVSKRLQDAQHYWICTVTPDGRPHATPVDGLWMDDRLYFGGSPATRWRRNLSANAAISVHLESATSVAMLQGEARMAPVDRELAQRLSSASKKKYGYAPKPDEYEKTGVLAFHPQVAFAWTNLPKDATRWHWVERVKV